MKKLALAVVALTLMAGTARAEDSKTWDLRGDIEYTAGFGVTWDEKYRNGTFNLNYGVTFLSIDKTSNLGLLGVGFAVDFYDYASHPAVLRDGARNTTGGLGLATSFFTFIPVRIGPLTYQVSLGEVTSHGLNRGRVHLITFDVLGWKRLGRI